MLLRYKRKELFLSNDLNQTQLNNSNLNLDEIDKEKSVLESYPRRIVLELTNDCNLNCVMCGRFSSEFKKTYFDINWLYNLESILPYVEEVTLMGWGEPTVHPKFIDMLKYLNEFNVRKYFCTNGMLLDKLKDSIFKYKADIIAVSLDSAKKSKNNNIRRGSDFDKITNGIRNLKIEQKKRNLDFPYINFVTTIMKDNLYELPDIICLADDLQIEEVKVVYLTAFSDSLKDKTLYNCFDEVKNVFKESLKLSEKLGIDLKLPYIQNEDIAGDKAHKNCYVGWRDLFIGSDGYTRPCMSTSQKFFHISEYNTFNELWNNKEYQKFRKTVNNFNCVNSTMGSNNSTNDCENKDMMPLNCVNCYQSSHCNWNKRTSFIQMDENFAPKWEKI
ncbi:MAG: radical SAM protein [Methanobrevibacter sp.]|jgi:MoaA/NifB/PqqE/SkfB family radical SAM enzyme|nr:radical SAM protein [Candidatus Methanoflexus mossambicus]